MTNNVNAYNEEVLKQGLRKITVLIEAKRAVEARRAWAHAIEAINPKGKRLETDPWVFFHFHYWVAHAWLESGFWCTARSILGLAPKGLLDHFSGRRRGFELQAMRQRIEKTGRHEWTRFYTWLHEQSGEPWKRVFTLIRHLRERIPTLPPPAAGDGEDGPSLTWSRPGVYVELEVLGRDLKVDWFARDRVDGQRDGVDDAIRWDNDHLLRWLERASRE